MSTSGLVAVVRRQEQASRLARARGDLWWLATEVLGYDRLTEGFHKPMLEEMDRRTYERRGGRYHRHELELWPRDHYKTTVRIAQILQLILRDPGVAVSVAHAVDEKAQEIVEEVGTHILKNKEFRRLWPEIMPSPAVRKFLLADQFTMTCRKEYRRHPTVQGKGSGSENTGGHCDVYVLDDIVGQGTIDDNLMEHVRRWYRSTVCNVLRTDGGWIWATGTRWDLNDIYSDWIDSEDWDVRTRHAMETDGQMDYQGTPVLYDMKWIERKRRELGPAFGPQMMNDPSPQEEKLWDSRVCENFCKLEDVMSGAFRVVLSDPAPAKVGSVNQDGKQPWKNEWATVTVAIQKKGQLRQVILLDGAASKDWEPHEGWMEICRQKRKWATGNVAVEKTGQAAAFYLMDLARVSREEGVKHREFDLTMTPKGKNIQFASLADRARQGEFLICDTVSKSFLGPFLEQCRNWRVTSSGKNSLRLDDRANVVSFAMDPVFDRYAPKLDPKAEEALWSPYRVKEQEIMSGARWVKW